MTDARDGYTQIFDQVIKLYPALLDQSESVRVKDGYSEVAHIAHGWYLRVHRGAEALLLLDANGYAEEASGIRRSMIEHCVGLSWLAQEGDVIIDTLARGHAVHTANQKKAGSTAGWRSIDPDEMDEIIASTRADERNARGDHLLNFAQRAARFGDANVMPGYYAECARTHPSYQSAICYVDLPGGDLLLESREAVRQMPFATTHVFQALYCLRTIFAEQPWQRIFDELSETFRSVTDVVRAEDGLPAVNWAAAAAGETDPGVLYLT